jgi:hypothetical protein
MRNRNCITSIPENEYKKWIVKNPRPRSFKGTDYEWAQLEMPVGAFWTWWRKHILGWSI